MPNYKTKHFPVDESPYISYTSQPDGTPDLITGVTVAPLTASVAQGGNTTFTASVVGSGNFSKAVTWKLTVESGGTLATGTAIDGTGKLTVGAAQATNKKLYVAAITANGIVSVPAVVTVTS